MSETRRIETRRIYRVAVVSIEAINRVLSQMADRLDQMEGYRGNPSFQSDVNLGGHRATNAGAAQSGADLTRQSDVAGAISSIEPQTSTNASRFMYDWEASLA